VAAGAVPTPADAAGTCIYLVRDVSRAGEIYTGDFLVLKRTGSSLVGYGGSFYSEGYNVKGVIAGSQARLSTQDPYQNQWTPSVRRWVVGENRLSGWKRVRVATMRKYSGGYVPAKGRVCG
jgi:hypothetical protein